MRRAGYTEEENPNHMICLLSGLGMALTMFTVDKLEPTPCEILRKRLKSPHAPKSDHAFWQLTKKFATIGSNFC